MILMTHLELGMHCCIVWVLLMCKLRRFTHKRNMCRLCVIRRSSYIYKIHKKNEIYFCNENELIFWARHHRIQFKVSITRACTLQIENTITCTALNTYFSPLLWMYMSIY